MARNFNSGVIVYDGQVERFDMVALPAENIEFPQGVMKKLDYFSDEVVMSLEGYVPTADLAAGDEFKMARMGHIKAVADFAGNEFQAAEQARIGLANQLAADKAELKGDVAAEQARAEGVEAGLQSQITSNDSDISDNAAAILAEKSRAEGVEAGLQSSIDTNATAILTEKGRAEGVEAGLQSQINTVDGKVDGEIARATAKEGELETAINDEKLRAEGEEARIEGLLTAEVSRATGAESTLQGNIDTVAGDLSAEVTRATGVESALSGAIESEKSRAMGEETLIRGEFAAADVAKLQEAKSYTDAEVLAEKTRAELAEAGLQGAIDSEAATSRANEATIQSNVDAEKLRAETAEAGLQGAIDAEKLRAETAESGLQGAIDGEKARIDAILEASTADADSFKEIVDLINSVDTENDQAFAGHVATFNAKMTELEQADSDEQAARIAGDNALSSSLDAYKLSNDAALAQEVSDRIAGDNALQAGLDAEIASTNTRFASATTDRGAIRSEFAAADLAMEEAFTAEIDALKAQDGVHTSDIAANASAITAEKTRAETAEAGLAADILAEKNRAEGQEAAIRGEFAAADVVLKGQMEVYTDGKVDGEKVRAEAAEAALQGQINSNDSELAVINGDHMQVGSIEHAKKAALDHTDAKFAEEKSRAEGVEAGLTQDIADETAARISGDNVLQGNIDALSGAVATDLGQLETDFQTALTAEQTARIAADNTLTANLAAEVTRAQDAELVNFNAITAEKTRAEGVEAGLAQDIADETAARIAAVNAEQSARTLAVSDLQDQFDAHELENSSSFAAASAARGVIEGNLAQELLDRAAGDVQVLADAKAYTDGEISTLSSALDAEIAATNADFVAAEQARVGLQSNIDAEKARIDAILEASTADADSFAEIVTLINSVDAENDTAFAGHVSAYNTKMGELDAADSAATVDRGAIRSELASEKAALQGEIAAGDNAVRGEFAAADSAMKTELEAADSQLQSDLADEIAARVAGDLAVTAAFEAADLAEKNAREAADSALQTALNNEVARATAKETELKDMQDRIYGGERHIVFNEHTEGAIYDSGGADFVPGKTTHILMSNSVVGAIATFPTLEPNKMVTVSLISTSPEPVELKAPEGVALDGSLGGDWTMYPGSSVTLVEFGGTYYMV